MGAPPPHAQPPVHMGPMGGVPPPDMRGPPMDLRGPPMGEPRNMMGDPRGPPMLEQRGPPMETRGQLKRPCCTRVKKIFTSLDSFHHVTARLQNVLKVIYFRKIL